MVVRRIELCHLSRDGRFLDAVTGGVDAPELDPLFLLELCDIETPRVFVDYLVTDGVDRWYCARQVNYNNPPRTIYQIYNQSCTLSPENTEHIRARIREWVESNS